MYFLQSLVVLALVVATIYFTLSALLEIFAMANSGAPQKLIHTWPERANAVLRMVFGEKKLLDDRLYGFMHFWYLYGFLILAIGHMELVFFGLSRFLQTFDISPFLYRNFLPSSATHLYEFSQDFMAFGVVIVVSIALYKRLNGKVARLLPRSKDAEIILWFIGVLYLTFFMFVGTETMLRMNSGELSQTWHWYLPISSTIALLFGSSGGRFANFFNNISWWAHLCVFLGFAIYIPRSKHLHLVAAGPNIYFRHFDAVAKPERIDFETAKKFGASKVTDLPWKSLLDTFACTECRRCDSVCPAVLTGKPLQPKKVLHDIKINLRYENWSEIKQHRDRFGKVLPEQEKAAEELKLKVALINREKQASNKDGSYNSHGQVHLDEIWSCTTCAACVDACPVLIDSVPTSLIDMRRNLVLMEASDYPKELNSAFKGLENQANPWGVGPDKRTDWTAGLDVSVLGEMGDKKVEYLFYVGCAGATDDRAKKIQQAFVKILKKCNVDFAILGSEEKCCGDPARRMGNEYVYDMLVQENLATLKKYNITKIFTACPHCFNQLKNEYKDYGLEISVQHHSELIAQLFADGKISFDAKNEASELITFHDPCYLGRYNNQYDAPRDILSSCPSVNTCEMEMSKRKSFCCGAGGARMFMEEHLGKRINHARCDQALATGASTIATACPFCMTMINDAVKDKGMEKEFEVKDIAEVVVDKLV